MSHPVLMTQQLKQVSSLFLGGGRGRDTRKKVGEAGVGMKKWVGVGCVWPGQFTIVHKNCAKLSHDWLISIKLMQKNFRIMGKHKICV